jgi:predicted MFS family arabinose efflux permease
VSAPVGRGATAPGPNPVIRVLLPFAGAYVLSYLYRSVNAVIASDLSIDFGLSAAQLGFLTSSYLLAFAAFQLPLGVLLDRFGPRRTDASLLLVAALGGLIFALADGLPSLVVGRALIGLGVSGCLMSGIKANVVWFPMSRLAAMNGWMFFAGGVGLMLATLPVEAAVRLTDWRTVFVGLCLLTLAASALIFIAVPQRAGEARHEPLQSQLGGLWRVFSDRRFWPLALCSTAMQSTQMAMQGLWAGPWLRDVAGFDRQGVASNLLLMAVATTAGFLFWANFATWLARWGVAPFRVFVSGTAGFLLFQFLVTIGDKDTALAAWIGYGFFGTAASLSYAILPQRFPAAFAGRVNTALNSIVFAWAFVVQWAMGAIIDLWPLPAAGYSPLGYRVGFGTALAIALCAWVWMLVRMQRIPERTDANSAAGDEQG